MVIQKYILLSSFENIYKKWDVTKKYKMYETVSLYTTLKIITFLRNNYFLCKHNLALRQREKVMQVKQWSRYSTPDHPTVLWQSFSLDTQAFNRNRVQFTSRLVEPEDSIQQNSHSVSSPHSRVTHTCSILYVVVKQTLQKQREVTTSHRENSFTDVP